MKKLAIVVPCYMEEAVLSKTTQSLSEVLDNLIGENLISPESFILYVNDGSDDKTWPLIQHFYDSNRYVCGLNLAGNVGHQNALVAGLTVAVEHSDIVVSIDADLQDDVNAIKEMVIKNNEGCDIVYGVRADRSTDTWFKRSTAQAFYKVQRFLGVKSVYNHADFRLMSKRAILQLLKYKERNLFLRSIVPMIGYDTDEVYYERKSRVAGESKYPLIKMLGFALDGITSFSIRPIRMVLCIGLTFLIIAFLIFIWVLYLIMVERAISGWASVILSIWFSTGCILIGMGVIGEYIGKIYIEVKNRPRFNIENVLMK